MLRSEKYLYNVGMNGEQCGDEWRGDSKGI